MRSAQGKRLGGGFSPQSRPGPLPAFVSFVRFVAPPVFVPFVA